MVTPFRRDDNNSTVAVKISGVSRIVT
jgi:hypothetical protein